MIGRRCKHSNVFSRPVLIARNLSGKPDFKPRDLSQEIYCGGYISVDPPLPIPNREVKHTGADGSAIPSVRVGSCRFSRPSSRQDPRVSLFFIGAKPPQGPCALIHHLLPHLLIFLNLSYAKFFFKYYTHNHLLCIPHYRVSSTWRSKPQRSGLAVRCGLL